MDSLYIPPKPALILPKPAQLVRPDDLRLKVVPPFLSGMILNPYALGGGVPATSYANTGGTGNRAGIVTATTTFGTGGGAVSALVDGTTGSGTYWLTNGQTSGNWVFDFGGGAAKYIDEFKWYQDTTANQGTYTFEGSNDNSSYTTIQTGITLGTSATQTVSLTPATSALWQYFRLRMTSGTTSSASFEREIEFKISA